MTILISVPRATARDSAAFGRCSVRLFVVIFNPKSTGAAMGPAEELWKELERRMPTTPIRLCPTQWAGHAPDLAREEARPQPSDPLGERGRGDNEVIDGAMQAGTLRESVR